MTRRLVVPLLGAAAFAAVMLLGWRCPIMLVFGVPCPTCGITRATHLALHGDFGGATQMHPLVWLVVPVVALFVGVETIGYVRTGNWGSSRRMRFSNVLMLGTSIALFVVWLARFAGAFGGPVR